jgi:hypothetical protein
MKIAVFVVGCVLALPSAVVLGGTSRMLPLPALLEGSATIVRWMVVMPPARHPSICVGSFFQQCLEVVDLPSPRPTRAEGSPLASWSRSPIRTITAAVASRKPDGGHAGGAALARGRKAHAVQTLGGAGP